MATYQVAASSDDASISNNGVNLSSTELTKNPIQVGDNAGANTTLVARFLNVAVPQGATISSATFKLTSQATYSTGNTISVVVACQAADNAGTFVAGTKVDNATRPRTSYSSAWDLHAMTVDVEYSKDITAQVQAVINRAGWASGNAIVVIVDNNASTNSEWQDVYSYDGSTTKAPKLDITLAAAGSSSLSPSASPSASISPSSSASASPSAAYTGYSRGDSVALPTTDSDLETAYSAGEVTNVSTSDDVRVAQSAAGQYMIHEYKNFAGNSSSCTLTWEGQTTLDPATSTVVLQIYNQNSATWEDVDTDNSSAINTDFILTANIANLTNYKTAQNTITCRVYQNNP